MFKSKEVRESTLKKLMGEAIDKEDWNLVKELRSIEKEQDIRIFEERINNLVIGCGAIITGVIIGGVVTKVIISKLSLQQIEG